LSAIDSQWRSQTNAQIDKTRKRDVRVCITDSRGEPLVGVNVEIRQKRKAFPFGAAISSVLLRNAEYRSFFKSHFNWAVFANESKWNRNERRHGQEDYRQADAMYDWCRENGIPVRGHCIFWEPEKWQPRWLREMDPNEVRDAVERRLDSVVNHFKGKFVHWDVNNEMLHGTFFKDNLGDDIDLWMFKRAHQIDPNVLLFVNEFNILSVDKDFNEVQVDEYVEHTKRLISQGAPIYGVGIQGHIWSEDILANPSVLKERLDKVAGLGLPIWISEFDVADEDEQSNADKLECVYRTAYSHPAVEGIMMWSFWARASWRGPNAALAGRDWTLNAAGKRYEVLMAEWSTNTSGVTDKNGTFTFRAFHGDYEMSLKAENYPPLKQIFNLIPGDEPQIVTLRMEKKVRE